MTVVGLCHELIVLLQAELWWRCAGFAPPRIFRSLTQLARPGSTDPDPESNRASRRGLLGEAGGQSGKGFGIWVLWIWVLLAEASGEEADLFGMGEVLPLQQQGSAAAAFSPGQGRHFSVLVAHLMDLVLLWEQLCLAGTTT